MKGKIPHAVMMAFVAVCFFLLISHTVFPWVMLVMRFVFFLCGIICAYDSFDYFSRYIQAYNRKKRETVYTLLFKFGIKTSIVNMLTVYRIALSPFLLVLAFSNSPAFKWLLLSAFLTDAMDGFLARYWKVTSKLGARLDSLADDFLFVVSLTALIYLHSQIIMDNLFVIILMLFAFAVKMIFLWFKHEKLISGLHTYFTKAAAFLQAVFFIYCMFFQPSTVLFYVTCITTIIAIAEEIIIICAFKELRQNVKGLFFSRSQM